MILSNDIALPILCPIQFREPVSVDLYPYQRQYVGKIAHDTYLMFGINAAMLEDDVVIEFKAYSDRGIYLKSYDVTKHSLSEDYAYADCTILAADFSTRQKVMFKILVNGDVMAQSLIYEMKPSYTKHLSLIEYTNSENDFGTVFGTFRLFVEAGFNPNDFKAKGDREDYQDQNMINRVIYSQPYCIETFSIGGSQGIPNWLYEKLNSVFMCDSIKINGVSYEVAKGSDMEKMDNTYDGLGRYQIELQKNTEYLQQKDYQSSGFPYTLPFKLST